MANLLLLNDANSNLRDDQGQTPLHVASAHGSIAILLILLKSAEDKSSMKEKDLEYPLQCVKQQVKIPV